MTLLLQYIEVAFLQNTGYESPMTRQFVAIELRQINIFLDSEHSWLDPYNKYYSSFIQEYEHIDFVLIEIALSPWILFLEHLILQFWSINNLFWDIKIVSMTWEI
jgi:hypothetical protein